MNLSNPFPDQVRQLYLYTYACADCGRSDRGLELHHIYGRVSGSAFNSIPLCTFCHSKASHNDTDHLRFIKKTISFLISIKYQWRKIDYEFLELPYVLRDLKKIDLSTV